MAEPLPKEWLNRAAPTDANGTEKYWADGLPFVVVYPASGAPATAVKDIISMGFLATPR